VPFSGDLRVLQAAVGQYLAAGTAIVSLTDLSQLWANFTATRKDSVNLEVGQVVRLKLDACSGRVFEVKVTTTEPQITSETRSIRVQATIANRNKILKPGMFVTATVALPGNHVEGSAEGPEAGRQCRRRRPAQAAIGCGCSDFVRFGAIHSCPTGALPTNALA
jgi:multidrug efflux pump subunit AcrA (membrane-fusion protein)